MVLNVVMYLLFTVYLKMNNVERNIEGKLNVSLGNY